MSSRDPVVCVLRHEGQPVYRSDWGGSLYLCRDEWHVYLPEDGGDPTMHSVLDDAVKRLAEAAFAAGRESALPTEEWRVCFLLNQDHPDPRVHLVGIYGVADDRAEADDDLQHARIYYPEAWIEHRRKGVSDWEKVPDVDL